MITPPVALSIAGSDSGGGAGLQADLRCFAALGVHGTCAVTAVTAQNTLGIRELHVVPAQVVDAQMAAVLEDLRPAAVKTGMLSTTAIMEAVAARAAAGSLPRLVVDPVMFSSSGTGLLEEQACLAYLGLLFPFATVVTPNLAEAAHLVGRELVTLDDMAGAARQLQRTGALVVVVKGGHLPGPDACDVVFDGSQLSLLRSERLTSTNLAGTGCTFSAAITSYLAAGLAPMEAVSAAKGFVSRAIKGAARWALGAGVGPLDQLNWSR